MNNKSKRHIMATVCLNYCLAGGWMPQIGEAQFFHGQTRNSMPVSEERLEEIKATDDSKINTSNIPEVDDDFWSGSRRKGRLLISHEHRSKRLCLRSWITEG